MSNINTLPQQRKHTVLVKSIWSKQDSRIQPLKLQRLPHSDSRQESRSPKGWAREFMAGFFVLSFFLPSIPKINKIV